MSAGVQFSSATALPSRGSTIANPLLQGRNARSSISEWVSDSAGRP